MLPHHHEDALHVVGHGKSVDRDHGGVNMVEDSWTVDRSEERRVGKEC